MLSHIVEAGAAATAIGNDPKSSLRPSLLCVIYRSGYFRVQIMVKGGEGGDHDCWNQTRDPGNLLAGSAWPSSLV